MITLEEVKLQTGELETQELLAYIARHEHESWGLRLAAWLRTLPHHIILGDGHSYISKTTGRVCTLNR